MFWFYCWGNLFVLMFTVQDLLEKDEWTRDRTAKL